MFFHLNTSCDRYDLELPRNEALTLYKYTESIKLSLLPEKQVDKRCNNRGSARRRRYTMKDKWEIVEMCDEAISSDDYPTITSPTQYFQYYYRNEDAVHKWVSSYGKWTKRENREIMVAEILGKNFASKGKFTRSPFHRLESTLYNEILTKRKSGHRVSNTFIRIRALTIFKDLQEQGVADYKNATFKASNGWRTNFIKRRKLKYRRRKSGKTSRLIVTYPNT